MVACASADSRQAIEGDARIKGKAEVAAMVGSVGFTVREWALLALGLVLGVASGVLGLLWVLGDVGLIAPLALAVACAPPLWQFVALSAEDD